jgi:hypothetical protein
MKNLLFAALLLFIFNQSLLAQDQFYNWTLYGSISPQQSPVVPDLLVNRLSPKDEFSFNLKNVKSELSIGVRRNFKFSSPFFGTLGVEYSEKQETYSMLFTYPNEPVRANYYDLLTTRRAITIPAGVGVRLGRFDLTSGLKAQYTVESSMKGDMTMGIYMDKPRIQVGWYAGAGINLNRVRIGIDYQSMLIRDGNYLLHNQAPLELMRVPNNVRFSVGFSF